MNRREKIFFRKNDKDILVRNEQNSTKKYSFCKTYENKVLRISIACLTLTWKWIFLTLPVGFHLIKVKVIPLKFWTLQ